MPNDESKSKPADTSAANTDPTPDESPIKSESLEGPVDNAASEESGPAFSTSNAEPVVKESQKESSKNLLLGLNMYFVIFVVLVLGAIGTVFFAAKTTKKPPVKTTKVQSLTDQQIASLKGSSTIVGDAKQTLDVQSNSIFEGQVLLRNSLNVAGTIQVGGNLSVPTIKVSGVGTLSQAQVDGSLNVGGDTALLGQLSVQKGLSVAGNASFGNLSASSLTISSLQLKGDLSIGHHLLANGSPVGRTAGTALGSGGTVSVSGNDVTGTITVNTGSGPAAGLFTTVNFIQKYASTPHVVITPVGSAAGSIQYYVNRDTNSFSIGTSTPPPASSSFSFDYFIIQ